jgi:hypothetical protein
MSPTALSEISLDIMDFLRPLYRIEIRALIANYGDILPKDWEYN